MKTGRSNLLAHRRSTSLTEVSLLGLGFVDTLGEGSSVFVLLGSSVSQDRILTWRGTYSSVLGLLSITALQRHAVALVLKALRSNETLNLGSFGIRLLSLTLWLNFTADNKLADLISSNRTSLALWISHTLYSISQLRASPLEEAVSFARKVYRRYTMYVAVRTSSSLVRPKNLRILVARLGPRRLG